MKGLSEQEIKAAAAECFAANKDHEKYFVTHDGQCFEDEGLALQHTKTVTGKVDEKFMTKFSRHDFDSKAIAPKLPTTEERVNAILAATNHTELGALHIGNDEPEEVQDALKMKLEDLDKK